MMNVLKNIKIELEVLPKWIWAFVFMGTYSFFSFAAWLIPFIKGAYYVLSGQVMVDTAHVARMYADQIFQFLNVTHTTKEYWDPAVSSCSVYFNSTYMRKLVYGPSEIVRLVAECPQVAIPSYVPMAGATWFCTATSVTFWLIFVIGIFQLILSALRVGKKVFVVESMVADSPILYSKQVVKPTYQGTAYDRTNRPLGSFVRLGNYLVTPEHVYVDAVSFSNTSYSKLSSINKPLTMTRVATDLVACLLTNDDWSRLGVSKPSVSSEPSLVRVVGLDGYYSVGPVTHSPIQGGLTYGGSTQCGFSGSSYDSNGVCVGIHIGGQGPERGNFGYSATYVSCLLDILSRPEMQRNSDYIEHYDEYDVEVGGRKGKVRRKGNDWTVFTPTGQVGSKVQALSNKYDVQASHYKDDWVVGDVDYDEDIQWESLLKESTQQLERSQERDAEYARKISQLHHVVKESAERERETLTRMTKLEAIVIEQSAIIDDLKKEIILTKETNKSEMVIISEESAGSGNECGALPAQNAEGASSHSKPMSSRQDSDRDLSLLIRESKNALTKSAKKRAAAKRRKALSSQVKEDQRNYNR